MKLKTIASWLLIHSLPKATLNNYNPYGPLRVANILQQKLPWVSGHLIGFYVRCNSKPIGMNTQIRMQEKKNHITNVIL